MMEMEHVPWQRAASVAFSIGGLVLSADPIHVKITNDWVAVRVLEMGAVRVNLWRSEHIANIQLAPGFDPWPDS